MRIRPHRLVMVGATGVDYRVWTDEQAERYILADVLADGWQVIESPNGQLFLAHVFGSPYWFASWDTLAVDVILRQISTVVVDGAIWGGLGDIHRTGRKLPRTRADNLH